MKSFVAYKTKESKYYLVLGSWKYQPEQYDNDHTIIMATVQELDKKVITNQAKPPCALANLTIDFVPMCELQFVRFV